MKSPVSKPPVVQAGNLHKTVILGETSIRILQDVNMEIQENTSVSISGSSGSGKTTLLGLLAGLDRPSSGSIDLFGQCIDTFDEDARAELRRGRVGFVFQSFHLLPNLTARENVALALEISPDSKNIEYRSMQALSRVGLSQRSGHLPSQMSGGEQQRVALARAMVVEPRLLFADEPTGNLDHVTSGHVTDLLFSLCSEGDCALVLVTHDRQLAQRCDRKYELDGGRLV